MSIKLLVEIIIHLLMPYPGISSPCEFVLLDYEVKYSVATILFFFSVARIYICFKMLKFWNFYSNERAIRILHIFKNVDPNLFSFKANLKARPLLFLIFLLAICIIYASVFIFKIFEHFSSNYKKDFYYEYNAIWFFMITVNGGRSVLI
jgi:hypothetical protein